MHASFAPIDLPEARACSLFFQVKLSGAEIICVPVIFIIVKKQSQLSISMKHETKLTRLRRQLHRQRQGHLRHHKHQARPQIVARWRHGG